MKICIVTPAPPRSRLGNRITAVVWAKEFRQLGHQVVIRESIRSPRCDLLVALHARRSHASIVRYRDARPDAPLVVALTGTDLYQDIVAGDASALESLRLATVLVIQHKPPMKLLPKSARSKVRIIHQSAVTPRRPMKPLADRFEVCVVGHLRAVKDPFRTVQAVARLPRRSRIAVTQLGMAMGPEMRRQAREYEKTNPRYCWLGDLPHARTLGIMSRCRLMVISSLMEGGPNVLTEALVMGLPVLATRIPAIVGRLGPDYAGLFPAGKTMALRQLLLKAEHDASYYESLIERCGRAAASARPEFEVAAWRRLLDELPS